MTHDDVLPNHDDPSPPLPESETDQSDHAPDFIPDRSDHLRILGGNFPGRSDADIQANLVDILQLHDDDLSLSSVFLEDDHLPGNYPSEVSNNGPNPPPYVLRQGYQDKSVDDSRELRYQFGLMNLLDEMRAPLNSFDKISDFIQASANFGADLTVPPTRRETLINNAANQLQLNGLRPFQRIIPLDGGGSLEVTCFDFKSQLLDLLCEQRLCDELLIDWECPSQPPSSFPLDQLSEIITGDWYKRTHAERIKHEDQLLAGLILGIDRSHVQAAQTERLSLEPVYFTLPIIPLHHRRQDYAWRVLGYVNNLHLKPSSQNSNVKSARGGPRRNMINYHRILRAIFQDLVSVQKDPQGLRARMKIPPKNFLGQPNSPHLVGNTLALSMFFPIVSVISDFEGHAKLCAFKKNTGRLISFDCDCPYIHSNDPYAECNPWTKDRVLNELYPNGTHSGHGNDHNSSFSDNSDDHDSHLGKSIDEETDDVESVGCQSHDSDGQSSNGESADWSGLSDDQFRLDNLKVVHAPNADEVEVVITEAMISKNLHALCYHHLHNAMYDLDFGSDRGRSIHGASRGEDVHQINEGIIEYLCSSFVTVIGGTGVEACRFFDELVAEYSCQFKHQSERDMPRTTLPHGFTNLTRLYANEWTGAALLTLTVLSSKLWNDAMAVWCRTKSDWDRKRVRLINRHRQLFEEVLYLEQWYKLTHHDRKFIESGDAKKRMQQFLSDFEKTVVRSGNGLRTGKFHRNLHAPDHVLEVGNLTSISGGTLESNHTFGAKKPAQNTQHRFYVLESQSAQRLFETNSIRIASQYYCQRDTYRMPVDDVSTPIGGSRFTLVAYRLKQDIFVSPIWVGKGVANVFTHCMHDAYCFAMKVCKFFVQADDDGAKRISCYTEHKRNGLMFRAHPNYRGTGKWFDFALFQYLDDNGDNYLCPGRIEFFLDLGEVNVDDELALARMERVRDLTCRVCLSGSGQYAVIRSFKKPPDELRHANRMVSRILQRAEFDSGFYLVNLDQIYEPCFSVEDLGGSDDEYFILKPKRDWGCFFQESLADVATET